MEERCTVAGLARDEADRAADRLHAIQRSYDDQTARQEWAAVTADPRKIREAKDLAQRSFRGRRAAAASAGDVEDAARVWLSEINAINAAMREATADRERAAEAVRDLLGALERRTVEADAARIAAETAEAACDGAREELARCDEAGGSFAGGPASNSAATADAGGDGAGHHSEAFPADVESAIVRILRGDQEILSRIVAELADDRKAAERWHTLLRNLITAIEARAIEDGVLDFPDDAFWGHFQPEQRREVALALASLGFRYDGRGGWLDARQPSQRDLSLAVGYAGLDPMRVRHWPTDAQIGDLMTGVRIASDEYLVDRIAGLSLGELVDLLGRRATDLADLWNDWGRIRPLLVEPG